MDLRTFLPLLATGLLMTGCATHASSSPCGRGTAATSLPKNVPKVQKVRTTAYSCREAGGARNAIGGRLSDGTVKSAAADWSRFPVGTKFRLVQTGEIYRIEDYGSALVGTRTIDLYKPSMSTMRAWGVRHVDIEIMEWGSPAQSLAILEDRTRNRHVRRMVEALRTDGQAAGSASSRG